MDSLNHFRGLQNDFLSPESSLFVAGGPAVIPAVAESVEIARKKGAFVVWVLLLSPVKICKFLFVTTS